MKNPKHLAMALAAAALCSVSFAAEPFPYMIPDTKPDMPLSRAMNRLYDTYSASTPRDNELYTQFRYCEAEGFNWLNKEGTPITRRDPTRILRVGDKYYMWYSRIEKGGWAECELWYATSTDGFTWKEEGCAVKAPKNNPEGWKAYLTPDILEWKGRYYLYYQVFFDKKNGIWPKEQRWPRYTAITLSSADSPEGPWTNHEEFIMGCDDNGNWDQDVLHDPQPIVFNGKIYLYYKSDYNTFDNWVRSTGVAIADNPYGPFVRSELNPVINSGHETQLFRFGKGIAAMVQRDGHERNTIQYSEDGINFEVAAHVDLTPDASGLYDPDAFTDVEDAAGITWGITHYQAIWNNPEALAPTPGAEDERLYYMLLRFDCDLSTAINTPDMKTTRMKYSLSELLKHSLSAEQRDSIIRYEQNK